MPAYVCSCSNDLYLHIRIEQIPHHDASHLPGSSDDEDIFSFTKFQRRCTCKCSDRYRKVRHVPPGFLIPPWQAAMPLEIPYSFPHRSAPALFRRKIRLLDLSYNFNLSKHSRIQSTDYAAQMCQAAFSFIPHSRTLQRLDREFLCIRKLLFQPYEIRVRATHIDLASITCHKQNQSSFRICLCHGTCQFYLFLIYRQAKHSRFAAVKFLCVILMHIIGASSC